MKQSRGRQRDSTPIGEIQVVLSGDFFQLHPVGSDKETARDKFAFMLPVRLDAKPVICYLTGQNRRSKNSLNAILNEVRSGSVSEVSGR